jgi:hypothetical protein
MTGLTELLEQAATEPSRLDVPGDLARGHRALRRRRTRWAAGIAAGGLAATGAVAYAGLPAHRASVDTSQPATDPSSSPSSSPSTGPSSLPSTAPGTVQGRFYDVPRPPAGWHVVGQRAQYVMLTRDGSGVTSIDSGFVGQIVVGLTDGKEHFEHQPAVQHDGRTFYVNATKGDPPSEDTATISVRSPDGNWLQIQFPMAPLGVDEMIAYLDGVVVHPGALPALG